MKSNLFTLIALSILALVCVPGCSESADTVAGGLVTRIATLEASSAQWNALIPRVQALENRPSGGSSFDASALNNKDNDLQSQINQLKSDRDNLKGQLDQLATKVNNLSSSGGTITTATGTVTVSTNPAAPPTLWSVAYTSGGSTSGGSTQFTAHLTNTSTIWQYAKITITLSSNTQLRLRGLAIYVAGGGYNLTQQATPNTNPQLPTITSSGYGTSNQQLFSVSPGYGTSTSAFQIQPLVGFNNNYGEFYLGPGQSADVNINISNMLTDANDTTTGSAMYTVSMAVIPHT